MTTENSSSEELETKLKNFFNDIDPKEMAKIMRKVNYALSLCFMRECETLESELPNIDDHFYWLNRLAEALDPYFDVQ